MNEEKEVRIEMIVDLMKMKQNLIPPSPLENPRMINPNITYCILETIIAIFMDKYAVKNEDITKYLVKCQNNLK